MKKLILSLLALFILTACGSEGAVTPALSGDAFSIGGTVSGLNGELILTNNGTDELKVTGQTFTFPKRLSYLEHYKVEIKRNPTDQTCSITDGVGEIKSKNVDSIYISCIGIPYIGNRIPVQDAFTISATKDAAGGYYDVKVTVTDRSHHSINDGTAINFRAETGNIYPSCITSRDGNNVSNCTVRFYPTTVPADKQISILAYTEGEESFIDHNSNGIFDIGESYNDVNNNGKFDYPDTNFSDLNYNGSFDNGDKNYLDLNNNNSYDQGDIALDLAEPFLDINDNKTFDIGEWFYDYNGNSSRDAEDHIFNGICDTSINHMCSAVRQKAAISASLVIVVQ